MKGRFFSENEWDERHVRAPDGPASSASQEGDEVSRLIAQEDEQVVRDSFNRAARRIQSLREDVEAELDDRLSMSTEGLPLTREAVKMMTGDHNLYGNELPEPDEAEKLENENHEIDRPVLQRAHRTMERADRNVYGFDAEEAVMGDDGGQVTPIRPPESPAEAAGEKPIPKGQGGKRSVGEQSEKRTQMKKMSMFQKVAQAVIPFVFNMVAGIFDKQGNRAKRLLNVSIAGASLGIGKFVAKPFFWIRDIIKEAADWIMDKIMGYNPQGPDKGSGQDASDLPKEELETKQYTNAADDSSIGKKSADVGSDQSGKYLASAAQILRTVQQNVQQNENRKLANALRRYESVRNMERNLAKHAKAAEEWGVRGATDAIADADAPTESTPQAQEADVGDEKGADFDC